MAADTVAPVPRFAGGWPAWPDYALVDDLLPTLERWAAQGRRIALATLVEVIGSSPRPVGSEMAIADDGECAGYVSGGCVEAAVASEAMAVLAEGRPRLLDYGAGSPVLDVQLSCGGRIRILVRELADPLDHVGRLRQARRRRQSLTVLTHLDSGAMQYADGAVTRPDSRLHARLHAPPLRLIVVGGDPIVIALLRLAPMFGIEILLLRPNGPEHYPDDEPQPVAYERRPLGSALPAIALDGRCAVYTLSHDADTDHAVLIWALRSEAFCIGALGSRSKARGRLERLRGEGLDDATLARLHSPAGLDIGARTPQEIALSILSQVIAERRPA